MGKRKRKWQQNLHILAARRLQQLGVPCAASNGIHLLAEFVRRVRPDLICENQSNRLLLTAFVTAVPYKRDKAAQAAKKKRDTYAEFYDSQAWLELRYQVLKKYGPTCMLCGRSRKDGAQIHVDHIKPRRHHPELELHEDNLQVLCRECNLGKRAHDDTDWRSVAADSYNHEPRQSILPEQQPDHLEVHRGKVIYIRRAGTRTTTR